MSHAVSARYSLLKLDQHCPAIGIYARFWTLWSDYLVAQMG